MDLNIKKLFACSCVLFFLACQPSNNIDAAKGSDNLQLANVESFSFKPEKGTAVVKIKGLLPNPSYSIERIDVKLEKEKIVLTPWMKHDPSIIAIQMTVPFEEEVKVTGLKKSTPYSINVKAQNKVKPQDLTL